MLVTNEIKTTLSEVNDVKKSFLYIGSALSKTKKCLSFYDQSFISKNLSQAKEFLSNENSINNPLPDLIILDIHYNKAELSEFIFWLKGNFKTKIPVIYNESSITSRDIKEIKELQLIDDIVKIENYCTRLHEKASFLKKTNDYLEVSLAADKFHNSLNNYMLKKPRGYLIKRIFDITISLIAIIFFIPLFILIAIAIRLESKGGIFYSSKRAGRGFKIFNFYKFRTMIPDADKLLDELSDLNQYDSSENSPVFLKVKDDPRVTKIGVFLRNTSLDELPQLFNVLKGDMSIVGNRPLPLYEAAALTTDEWSERFMAPAGITGLWQISKRGHEDMSTQERISLDIEYARTHSLKVDLLILLKTPSALFQKSNV